MRESLRVRVDARLVWASAALVCLYVLDDAFVHPEAGTTAADHLLSGLVVPVVVVAGAILALRLRDGARGALLLVLGALAIVAGVADGLRPALLDRLSGDDLSAMLAAVAGAVLVGAGVATIWRSRRLDERRGRRYLRRALVGVVSVVAAAELVYPVGMSFVATHPARAPVQTADLGRPYVPVAFTTSDGLRLRGWYVPSRNGAAIIVFPGRRPNPVRYGRMLARHGYGVLLFDRRGEGQSEGDGNLLGWGGEKDLLAAIGFLGRRPEVKAIGGLGLSVGGELMLQTAAETPKLRAVVSEGAGQRSLREQMHVPASHWLPVGGAALWSVMTGATTVLANEGPPPDLVDLVRRIRSPVLLVYGSEGQSSEQDLTPVYYDAARAPKAIWEVPGAGHTGGLAAQPAAYERRVVEFFDRALR
jgi:dienelactone hydrolase